MEEGREDKGLERNLSITVDPYALETGNTLGNESSFVRPCISPVMRLCS